MSAIPNLILERNKNSQLYDNYLFYTTQRDLSIASYHLENDKEKKEYFKKMAIYWNKQIDRILKY